MLIEKEKLEKRGQEIDNNIRNNTITMDDINTLMATDSNTMFLMMKSRKLSNRKRILLGIYFNPYYLYFSKEFNKRVNDYDLLSKFVSDRFSNEKYELDLKFENGEYYRNTYKKDIEDLEELYFYSSPIGVQIKRISEREEKLMIKNMDL